MFEGDWGNGRIAVESLVDGRDLWSWERHGEGKRVGDGVRGCEFAALNRDGHEWLR